MLYVAYECEILINRSTHTLPCAASALLLLYACALGIRVPFLCMSVWNVCGCVWGSGWMFVVCVFEHS